MTIEKDYVIHAKDSYDFMNTWIKFVGIHSPLDLTDHLRHIYVTAMLLPHDEPFSGNGSKELLKNLNSSIFDGKPYFTNVKALAAYKYTIKSRGWLNDDGTLPPFIKQFRKLYKKDLETGNQSISLLYKICVC